MTIRKENFHHIDVRHLKGLQIIRGAHYLLKFITGIQRILGTETTAGDSTLICKLLKVKHPPPLATKYTDVSDGTRASVSSRSYQKLSEPEVSFS